MPTKPFQLIFFKLSPPNKSFACLCPYCSFHQHMPLCHTVVKPEAQVSKARGLFLNCVSYIWEFLGNVWWYSWEFPTRKLPRRRGVSPLEIPGLLYDFPVALTVLKGSLQPIRHFQVHFEEIEFVGIHFADCFCMFYHCNLKSRERASNPL